MRYVLAAIFFGAFGIPAASALTIASPQPAWSATMNPFVQVVRHRSHSRRAHGHRRGDGGGIHPLVGSGDY